MAKRNNYTGDGKALYDAVFKEGMTVMDAMAKFNIAKGTLFNYYNSDKLRDDIKVNIAKTLKTNVEEIFSIKYENKQQNQEVKTHIKYDNNSIILQSRQPERIELFRNGQINNDYLQSILPNIDDKKKWVPYYSSILDLIGNSEVFTEQNIWPMEILPEEILRTPFGDADVSVLAPHIRTMKNISPNSLIDVKYTAKKDIRPGVPYLIVFNNRDNYIYYISESKYPGKYKLETDYGQEINVDMEDITAIFKIISTTDQFV